MQEAWIQSLVREPASHTPWEWPKIKKRETVNVLNKESREMSRIKTSEETGLSKAMLPWLLDWNKHSSRE